MGECFLSRGDIKVLSPGHFSASENFFLCCICQRANTEYFRMWLKGRKYLDLCIFLLPLVQESTLSMAASHSGFELSFKEQTTQPGFLPAEGILWEAKVTESFPDSPVLEAAQQCKGDWFYLPSSLGHQYTILQEEHNRVWVGVWEGADETWWGLKGQWIGLWVADPAWNARFH